MGHNVQSKAGETLTDVYDVRGGQAPIERIITAEVQATHDMAGTIFSERASGNIRRRTTGDLLQSIVISEVLDDFPLGNFMVHGIQVITDDASRLASVVVSARTTFPVGGEREFPIWVWDGTNSIDVRIVDNGSASAILALLQPEPAMNTLPALFLGNDQPQAVAAIAMRGLTTSFGAGTVETILLVRTSFADIGGISSRGLPIPSW